MRVLSNPQLHDIEERSGLRLAGYTGRGMYAQRCLAVVGDMADFARFVAATVQVLGYDQAIGIVTAVSTDAMGMDKVFYFRGVEPPHIHDEEDE